MSVSILLINIASLSSPSLTNHRLYITFDLPVSQPTSSTYWLSSIFAISYNSFVFFTSSSNFFIKSDFSSSGSFSISGMITASGSTTKISSSLSSFFSHPSFTIASLLVMPVSKSSTGILSLLVSIISSTFVSSKIFSPSRTSFLSSSSSLNIGSKVSSLTSSLSLIMGLSSTHRSKSSSWFSFFLTCPSTGWNNSSLSKISSPQPNTPAGAVFFTSFDWLFTIGSAIIYTKYKSWIVEPF